MKTKGVPAAMDTRSAKSFRSREETFAVRPSLGGAGFSRPVLGSIFDATETSKSSAMIAEGRRSRRSDRALSGTKRKMPRENLPWQGMRSVGELSVAGFALVFERLEQIFGADDLAVERAGNQRVALDIALFCAGDGDAVDLQGAAKGALVIRFGFGEIGEGAELGALRGDQVALGQDHVVDGGSAKAILFVLGVKRLLLQLAGFAGGLHLRAALFKSDGSVADVEHGAVLDLLHLRFQLPLGELRVDAVRLRRTVAQRQRDV